MSDAGTTPFAAWRRRMGWTQRQAAEALGVTLATYQQQEAGKSYAGRPRRVQRLWLLACAALEQGVEPLAVD